MKTLSTIDGQVGQSVVLGRPVSASGIGVAGVTTGGGESWGTSKLKLMPSAVANRSLDRHPSAIHSFASSLSGSGKIT